MGGKRELIAPLSQQALDLNFDGLMIESHCNPDNALSDAAQQVSPDVLSYIVKMLVVRDNAQTTENISILRQKIDELDSKLLDTLAKRMDLSREIGIYKKEHNMPILQSKRYGDILHGRSKIADQLGHNLDFVSQILKSIHEESVRIQMELMNK
jgi:chorismate mutase